MVRLCVGSVVFPLLLAMPVPAAAQHAEGVLTEGCSTCHGPHGTGSPGVYNLKVGDVRPWGSGGRADLGPRSTTCLRCHASEDIRRSQPDASTFSLAAGRGRFVGLDLTGQHPLGPLDRIIGRDALPGAPPNRGPSRQFRNRDLESVECTSCHDPHARGAAPSSAMVTATCLECHDATPYRNSHVTVDCQACHDVHRPDPTRRLLAGPGADSPCRDCHLGGAVQSPWTGGSIRPPEGHTSDPQTVGSPCLGCHVLHN